MQISPNCCETHERCKTEYFLIIPFDLFIPRDLFKFLITKSYMTHFSFVFFLFFLHATQLQIYSA